jgi:SMODS-associated and fused to various effectors sensor domain/CHAT domain
MTPKITYQDFEIEIRSTTKGKKRRSYEARVLTSPLGRAADGRFVLPYPVDELDDLLKALESGVLVSSGAGRDAEPEDPGSKPLKPVVVEELGRRLFRSLFPEEVKRCFCESMGFVRGRGGDRQDHGLRVRVTFDRKEDFAVLATLPWEFLWEEGQFVNRSRLTPVVRSLNEKLPPMPGKIESPLRVLLIPSDPKDMPSLKTRHEAKLVTKALKRNPGIKAVTLDHLRIDQLRSKVVDGAYHVVQFMGHGGFHENEFVLYFEGEDGNAEPVTGMLFAEFLHAIPGLRLVALTSCWSGAFPRHQGQDPLKGVAASLMTRGIPAVVAMQFPITDEAAIAFSEAFYERIAAGDPVSAAATEGRLAIMGKQPESFEWATPVVFLAGDDPRLEVRKSGRPSEPAKSAEPLKLAIRSFWNPFIAETEPDDVLDLSEFFEGPKGRHIKKFSLWREEVFPRLEEFLLRHARERRPIVFDFAAHATIAFAAGYCLEAKSGLDVTLLQKSIQGVRTWKAEAGPAREGPLWQEAADETWNPDSSAVALAVSATNQVLEDVRAYLKRSKTAVRRIVPLTVHPQPGQTAVEDGLHALQLAQDLSLRIRGRSPQERARPLHLFAAAPNALLFFLGQLARSFGGVQLYEHDFGSKNLGAYVRSLRLPVE